MTREQIEAALEPIARFAEKLPLPEVADDGVVGRYDHHRLYARDLRCAREALAALRSAKDEMTQRDAVTRDRDIILEAINSYHEYMLDDDFDAQAALNKIMGQIISRADAPAKDEPSEAEIIAARKARKI